MSGSNRRTSLDSGSGWERVGVLDLILEKKPDWILYQDEEQRNPLHWAASMGYLEGVRNLLGKNTSTAMERDKDGFFPIHMASAKGHVHVIQELLQHWPYVEEMLNSKGVPRNPNASAEKQGSNLSEVQSRDNYKDRANTLLLVSTLVDTVTFAARFTIPGGYNSSGEDQGMATMLSDNIFYGFIFCNTIAMFSSIFVAVTLIWAQLGDIHLVLIALRAALPLLGVALATMSLAVLAGIYLVVSKW
ncbi:hypothetical protein SO802_015687 [Lithocarpus litseifolius]|uniref:PGG domain-containing protein n=1 Tax=Lithocarpus litseifolius TaxID=425828 RepID=A0AAW2CY07_9ROSI